MLPHSTFISLLLGVVLATASPFYSDNELTSTQDERKTEPQESEVYRLNDYVKPTDYELRIVPDLEKFTFSGKVTIGVNVILATNRIELHSKNLKIKSFKLKKIQQLIDSKLELDEENDLLIIETAKMLNGNDDYTLIIEFEGVLQDEMKGFYKSSYMVDGKEKWLAVSKFEPIYAREAFPCFDEPRFRAPFNIYVGRRDSQTSISNMPRQYVTPKDPSIGNLVWEKFKKSPPMATYLVAFMVSEFTYIAEDKVAVWMRENAVQQASYALKQGNKLLQQLEDYTGISYALPKLDIVAIPDFKSGAMENWGMTTYREKYVLLDERTCSEIQKGAVTEVISHEFSHQWFGDLVTPAWWDFLWLNEGFATYFEYFNTAEVEPTWKLDQLFVVEAVQAALWNEITRQRAMTTSITTISQIKGTFDIISYDKAGSVIRMLEHIVSPSTFRSALHEYLQNGRDKNGGTVVQKDLLDEFDHQAYYDSSYLPPRVSVSDIMKTWTENIGYPLITAKRNPQTGDVEITQSTYKSSRAPKPAPDQEWIVPLSYTTKSQLKFSETRPTLWSFAHKTEVLKEKVPLTDWYILNLQQSGYYRVTYDKNNWKLITDQLHQKHESIHVLNRAQLIDDSLALAADEIICYHVPLVLLQYLTNERDLIPWYSALIGLNAFYSKYEATPVHNPLREYLINIVRAPYTNFGFDIKPSDDHLVKKIKPFFLKFACALGLEGCVQNALEAYETNKNDLSKVQPDLKRLIFCNALRHSQDQPTVFKNIWNLYLKLDSAYDKNLILMSLSCTTNNEVINEILSKIIDSKNKEIRDQDKIIMYTLFFSQIPAVTGSIAFLRSKISTISELDDKSISSIKEILNAIAKNVKTEDQIQQLKTLEEEFKKLDQKKVGPLTKIIQEAHTKGAKTVENDKKKSEHIASILREFTQPQTTSLPEATTKEPNSRASTLISSFWSNIIAASLVLLSFQSSKCFLNI